jgi:ribonucleoside-diphosphate reductase alpha chain
MKQLKMSILNDPAAQPVSPLLGRQVLKRDGSVASWDSRRITRAIALAYYQVTRGTSDNPHRDNPDALFGLDEETYERAEQLTGMVERAALHRFAADKPVSIDDLQNLVETCIAMVGDWEVARSYVVYRTLRDEARPRSHEQNGLQDFIAVSRYARYRPDLSRREVWSEAAERVRNMHLRMFAPRATSQPRREVLDGLRASGAVGPGFESGFGRFASLTDEIWTAFELVKQRKILPSMRSVQFGGPAIEAAHARLYNCSFSYADRPAFFREAFYLLLCGTGVGFSVQKHHVEKLPAFPVRGEEMELPVKHVTVPDTIEGWSDAIGSLFDSFYENTFAEFNFSLVRPRGAPLRTAGGRAPGHLPLKRGIEAVSRILRGASGRQLRPIEVYDIIMHLAQAVLSGGVRRSATICLFSPDDAEMANAKTGSWFETNPQRAFSNNSALLDRKSAAKDVFEHLFERQKEFGEPGFYFSADKDYGANPCVEIGLHPRITATDEDIPRLRALGFKEPLAPGDVLTGWQMCNLSTINGAAPKDRGEFLRLCKYAALLGTLQAAYTDIPYLGPVTRWINQREALLGVSICGILDNPELLLDPATLEAGAEMVRGSNALFADLVGIRRAARTTCVKPEGTASLLLGTGSGIHPHHARRYFRRVQVNRIDPVYRFFKHANAHMTEKSAYNQATDDVVTFPVEAPEHAITRHDLSALRFLEYVKLVQRHWVEAGCASDAWSPGLHHNVSNTISVAEHEWDEVSDFIWENRQHFTGIALLTEVGDKTYLQAPREELSTPEDVRKWNALAYNPVDYSQMRETSDATALRQELACAGGTCELSVLPAAG